MLGLAIVYDFMMIKAVHILTYISMYLANVTFGLLFHYKLRKEDSAFIYWHAQDKKPYYVYKYLIFLFNFKSVRGLYS